MIGRLYFFVFYRLRSNCLCKGFVVLCSLGAFISLVWLREQILSGGGPGWLDNNDAPRAENADHLANDLLPEDNENQPNPELNEDLNQQVQIVPNNHEQPHAQQPGTVHLEAMPRVKWR